MRVYVGPDEALVVTNKFGKPLPPDRIVVPTDDNRTRACRKKCAGRGDISSIRSSTNGRRSPLIEIPAGDPQKWQWNDDGNAEGPEHRAR